MKLCLQNIYLPEVPWSILYLHAVNICESNVPEIMWHKTENCSHFGVITIEMEILK